MNAPVDHFEPGGDFADEQEFVEVYRDHFGFVYASLRRLGVEEAQLDDAAQDVFVVVHRRLLDFEYASTVRTWLFSIARRVAYRYRRSRTRTERRHAALSHVPAEYFDADEIMQRRQARQALLTFLEALDDDKREAFICGELEGMGRAEIGEALGINPNTAYSRLRSAREQFEATLSSPEARADLLARARERDPELSAARRRVWAVLVPALLGEGVAAAAAGGGGLVGASALANVKIFALTVAAGVAAIVVTRSAMPEASAEAPVAMVASVAAPVQAPAEVPAPQPPAPAAEPVMPEPPAAEEPEPSETPSVTRNTRRTAPAPGGIEADRALLDAAAKSLAAGKADAAFRKLRRHERDFGASVFAPEREVLFVDVLCAMGRTGQAGDRARRFIDRNPGAPATARMKKSCGLIKSD